MIGFLSSVRLFQQFVVVGVLSYIQLLCFVHNMSVQIYTKFGRFAPLSFEDIAAFSLFPSDWSWTWSMQLLSRCFLGAQRKIIA